MKIAFVVPFYGAEARGGAESECRNTVLRLAESGEQVEVFTTCLIDLEHDWKVNAFSEGTFSDAGIKVHRFRPENPDLFLFEDYNPRLIRGETLSPEQQKQFLSLHINSVRLYRRIAAAGSEFDWFCFIPYLFGTTFYGSMIHPEKSVLIPCLHDEGYSRMGIMKSLFDRVRRIVYHTRAEKELARTLYGNSADKGLVLGEGINTGFSSSGARFREKYGITSPFVLYAGRKDSSKNVNTMIRYFLSALTECGNNVKLVMIGPESISIPSCDGSVVDLGFVPEQDKKDAYSAALCLCQPSLNESFSIVMMEAWLCGTPCLVHGKCPVTRDHVTDSGGGLYFNNAREFHRCISYFLEHPDMSREMGLAGRNYVMENFQWPKIIEKYKQEIFVS